MKRRKLLQVLLNFFELDSFLLRLTEPEFITGIGKDVRSIIFVNGLTGGLIVSEGVYIAGVIVSRKWNFSISNYIFFY